MLEELREIVEAGKSLGFSDKYLVSKMETLIWFRAYVLRNEKKTEQLKKTLEENEKFKTGDYKSLTDKLKVSYTERDMTDDKTLYGECHINFGDFIIIVIGQNSRWPIIKYALNHDNYKHTNESLLDNECISKSLYDYYNYYNACYKKNELHRTNFLDKFFGKFDGNIQEYLDCIARLWISISTDDDSDDESN